MPGPRETQDDIERIVARRHDNGADFWATADGRWGVGSPFSTFDCALILNELGVEKADPVMRGIADRILATWREDGRFRAAPKGTIHPCHTANAARALCRLGWGDDPRLQRTLEHLLETQHVDGGWRCNAVRLGKSPETDASNPGTTLSALDALRFSPHVGDARVNRAVEFLLDHWRTRKPLGPCQFGIGSRFLQVEFPFLRYNLFFYVHVLSFYPVARNDPRFQAALDILEERCTGGAVVVESPNRKLARFSFCRRGEPSEAATRRMNEVRANLRR